MAGLLVALNGTLIVYEQYVMAETLFTFLLAAAALALVLGARRASWRLYALGGLLLALATLDRAAAELLLPVVPLVALVWHRSGSGRPRATPVAMLAGFLVLIAALDAGDLGPGRQPRGLGAGRGAVLARHPRDPDAHQPRPSAVPRTWPIRPARRRAASPTTASSRTICRATSRC